MGFLPTLYTLWATAAIGLSIASAGLSAENITRLLVIAFLLAQILFRSVLLTALSWLAPRERFLILSTALASVIEGFHMISMPVFKSLTISPDTSFFLGLSYYAVDLLFTIPAYLVIFSFIWFLIRRYRFSTWQYVMIVGLGQTLGDGGLTFFLETPAMLLFLPYPMTNYHAMNVIPFLAVRDHLHEQPPSRYLWLAVPGLILTYFACGTFIKLLGRPLGFE
jgi:hypothetical protein